MTNSTKTTIFTITNKHVQAAKKNARLLGIDFADATHLPTTLARANKNEAIGSGRIQGVFAALAGAHLVRIGAGDYTASQLLSALAYGLSKADMKDKTGSNAMYDALRFYRNAILARVTDGTICDSNDARRVDVKSGKVRAKASRAPRAPGSVTKGKGKAKGASPVAGSAHKPDGKPCTVITIGNVKRTMKAESMAAFIANVATQYMISLECEDSGVTCEASLAIDGAFAKLVADICAD